MKVKYISYDEDSSDFYEKIVDYLVNENIVAWFQGKSEFGPRALGYRSILMDPRIEDGKDFINNEVKHREWWRPFAPIVLENFASKYFDIKRKMNIDNYMLSSAEVLSPDIPAVTHADKTARVQIVSENNIKLYKLLLYY